MGLRPVPAGRRSWAAIPERYQNVAGGRSRAETSGPGTDRIAHPGRVPEPPRCRTARYVMDRCPDRAFLASFRDVPACGRETGGVAMLNPRLRSGKPSGLKKSNRSPFGSGWPAAMGIHPGGIAERSRRSQKSKFPKPNGLPQASP